MVAAVRTSETSANFNETTRRYIPEGYYLQKINNNLIFDKEYKLWISSLCLQFSAVSCYSFPHTSNYSPQRLVIVHCQSSPDIFTLSVT
jgi:hypothetical protein